MALIKCPECGNTVSDKAETCPHCGIKIALALQSAAAEATAAQPVTQQSPTPSGAGTPQVEQPQQVIPQQPVVQPQPTAQPQPKPTRVVRPQAAPLQAEEEPKKSNTLLIVSFVIALVLFGIGFYFYNGAQEANEQRAYEDALHSEDPAVLSAYLTRYNDAPQEHKDSINAHLERMKSADLEWSNACAAGTKSALVKYIEANPNTYHKGEALNKIDSIDFAIASRNNNSDSYGQYLKEHPDGKYADKAQEFLDNKKATEVQTAEVTLVRTVCKHFFQAINSKSESKLTETIADYLGSFLNRSNASSDDVVTFMKRLYKDEDITNMNWHILDDFKVEKVEGSDGQFNYKATFGAEQNIERTDAAKTKYAKYEVTAEVNSDGKIVKFNMKKVAAK